MILPVLGKAKERAKITFARNEVAELVTAISHYESTYSRWPASKPAFDSAAANAGSWDFTFGTTDQQGAVLKSTYPTITSYPLGNQAYYNNNSEVVGILMDLEKFADGTPTVNVGHVRNPQHNVYLNLKQASATNFPGLGPDGVYRDPWGNPYIISFDMNFDSSTFDGFYSTLRKKKRLASLPPAIPRNVLVWSFGPDGKVDASVNGLSDTGKGTGDNKDNILSWEQ